MKLPELEARVHAEASARQAAGLTTEVVDFDAAAGRDEIGLFLCVWITLANGDVLTFHTRECSDVLARGATN